MKFPMAKRQYKYVVTITTKRGNNLNGQILEMPYTQARVGHTAPKVDRVEIHSTFIRLTAIRSNDTSPESIVKDNSGTLHKQILKQVLLYYASNLSNPGIKEITVIKDGVENGKYIESYSPLNEPLRNLHWQSDQAFNANDLINHIKLEFDLYGVILSYWLTGISEKIHIQSLKVFGDALNSSVSKVTKVVIRDPMKRMYLNPCENSYGQMSTISTKLQCC